MNSCKSRTNTSLRSKARNLIEMVDESMYGFCVIHEPVLHYKSLSTALKYNVQHFHIGKCLTKLCNFLNSTPALTILDLNIIAAALTLESQGRDAVVSQSAPGRFRSEMVKYLYELVQYLYHYTIKIMQIRKLTHCQFMIN